MGKHPPFLSFCTRTFERFYLEEDTEIGDHIKLIYFYNTNVASSFILFYLSKALLLFLLSLIPFNNIFHCFFVHSTIDFSRFLNNTCACASLINVNISYA